MSVTSEDNKVNYEVSGAASYVIPFYFTSSTHIRAFLDEEEIIGGFNVTGAGEEEGGELTFTGTPPDEGDLTILRDIPIKQESSFNDGSPNSAATFESLLDKLTMISQQLNEKLNRAALLPLTSTMSGNLPLGLAPGETLIVNDDGTGFDRGPTATQVYGANADAIAAAAAKVAAQAAEVAAEAAQVAAETAATAAALFAENADDSATAAAASATAAQTAKTAAEAAQAAAAISATAAATSATNSGNSATAAATSATNAGNSATAAAASATAAQTAKTAAEAAQAAAELAASNFDAALVATQSVAAAGTVTITTKLVQNRKVQGNGGAQTTSNTPFGGAVATDGIQMRLIGQSDVNTLTVPFADVDYGVLLNGDAVLGKGHVLTLLFDLAALRWYEISRNF